MWDSRARLMLASIHHQFRVQNTRGRGKKVARAWKDEENRYQRMRTELIISIQVTYEKKKTLRLGQSQNVASIWMSQEIAGSLI